MNSLNAGARAFDDLTPGRNCVDYCFSVVVQGLQIPFIHSETFPTITEMAQHGLGRNQTIKLRDRSVPIRGSVGGVSRCLEFDVSRNRPDATATRD